MKNFTNNFKQFTSRLSARWLLMALMLLLGTSSVWAATYLSGTFNGWNAADSKYLFSSGTLSVSMSPGTYEFKVVEDGKWYSMNNTNITGTVSSGITMYENNNNNNITITYTGVYTFIWDGTNNKLKVTYPPQCSSSTSITSAELQQDGTISLVGNFTTCGAKYHGFQWRKVGSNWCGETGYANNKESNYVTIGNTDVNGSETASFTPEDDGIYEFRTYIVTTSPWLYSTSIEEVSTCTPLPTINISGSEEAVLYEDVTLTATGENIANVVWTADKGTITKDATDPKKAVLTYDQAGTVTVTATATSAASCTSATTKTVTFSAENCNSTTRNDLIITCNPNGYYGDVYLHIWPNGESSLTGWPGYKGEWKDNVWRWEISASLLSTSKQYDIIFNNNEGSQTQDLDHDLIPGNQYNYTLNHTDWGNGNNRPTMGTVDPIPLSQPAPISAPAAKTISVSTTDGEGNIIFSGQVVKTGCDATNEYGFQYSLDEQTWTTVKVGENAVAGTAISNNTVNGLDGTYYVRAYITNDNSTQYGEIKEITVSTEKDPITKVTLTHVRNQAGDPYSEQELENLIYCVGDTVWFKLEQDGSNFQEYEWISYPGTGLKGMYPGGMFKLKITRSGNVGIRLRNEENVDGEGNPTWVESNSLVFNTHPEPTAPYISINPASGVICQGSSATITVENPSADCSYKLVEENTKAGFTPYESGDLKYTVQNVGKYYVVARHDECPTNEYTSNQVAINQVISTDATISIEQDKAATTPWEPVTITVNPEEGYVYELSYTDNNLAGVAGVIIKQNGDSYTYYIPRPDNWTTGDSNPVRDPINYGIKAQLKVDGEASQCDLNAATATIQLKDEDNENCPK